MSVITDDQLPAAQILAGLHRRMSEAEYDVERVAASNAAKAGEIAKAINAKLKRKSQKPAG